MIGVVVVSHSAAVAQAAVGLARQMVPAESELAIEVAAGTPGGRFGTDATAIAAALESADSGDGVLVLMDLGSAVMSAELALEFVDPDLADRVRLSSAPLVEGLLVAATSAAAGAPLDEVADEADAALTAKREHLGESSTTEQSLSDPDPGPAPDSGQPERVAEVEITNTHGLHARPVATLVAALRALDAVVELSNATTGRGPAPATSVTKVATLGLSRGHRLRVSARGPEAERAVARVVELAADEFGERATPPQSAIPDTTSPEPTSAPRAGSGRQIVLAPAAVPTAELDLSGYEPGSDEAGRARAALDALRGDLCARADSAHGDIFAAQLALLDDLAPTIADRVAAGATALIASHDTLTEVAEEFDQLADPHLRDRAQDVRSLRLQLLGLLIGDTDHAHRPAQAHGEHVLVVTELDALTASSLDPAQTLAVVTLTGGSTGHGVLVATSRGIPVVTGQSGLQVAAGDLVAVDPVDRRVWVNPSATEADDLRERARERAEAENRALERAGEPATTTAGATIAVKGNVSNLTDARLAAANGADGSGLVRTELLFGDLDHAPTAREQADALIAIGRALEGRPITVRTWDAGADKPLRFIPQPPEANPFLGERGIRTMRRLPDLFDEQLRAVVLAHRETPVRVMLPMVTTPDEVLWARRRLDAVTAELTAELGGELGGERVELGMMVEVPAAAIRAGDFADLVDFASIGTNDLLQYVSAVDRSNASLERLTRDAADAVFDLVTMTCLGLMGLPVCVCGDLASDLDAVPRLIAAGITELSVRPTMVGLVKQTVREC
ncbi:dihydroxyacetone kinase phosphoryl donor subunit DhaM [Aestuariimicrobium soli]|uniref:dihydroxyacetone kinase phosphoryl donor subunit DhaM n=1 Tax=Aestuariimicrobium soli TaxID=2035834 RepID=UPI003EB7B30C